MHMLYFETRKQAGELLADLLIKYRYDNAIVVALSDGAVQVGEQIAKRLHCIITILMMEDISLPREPSVLGTIDERGGFTYNSMFSTGEIEEFTSEYFNFIELEKLNARSRLNKLLGEGGILDEEMFKDHTIILVSDGAKYGTAFDVAASFFKPIRVKKLIAVTPMASVAAIDKLHLLTDEIQCLSVTSNYLDTDHYYEINDVPTHEATVDNINTIIKKWT